MAQQFINDGEKGLIVRGKINSNFTELYGLGYIPQYYIMDYGGTACRIGMRGGRMCRDITLTPTGFTGSEGVDWANIDAQGGG